MVEIPADVRQFALRRGDEGCHWLRKLPTTIDECIKQWELELCDVRAASFSFVATVRRADGTPAVLKITFPEPEGEHEADALRLWDGNGIVRLYESDRSRSALLLELLEPGTSLREHRDEGRALAIACSLLPRLWLEVGPDARYERISDLAPRWSEAVLRLSSAAQLPIASQRALEAASIFREFGSSQRNPVLIHRDFHRGNILAAQREPWLAIDPKPSVGEREFDAAWLLGSQPADKTWLLDELSTELGLDRQRLRGWGVARYVLGGLWTYESGADGADALAIAAAIRDA